MVFDGFVAELQDQSDGLGGLALGQQLEDLALARGQPLKWTGAVVDLLQGKFLEEPAGDLLAEIDFPADDTCKSHW